MVGSAFLLIRFYSKPYSVPGYIGSLSYSGLLTCIRSISKASCKPQAGTHVSLLESRGGVFGFDYSSSVQRIVKIAVPK